MVIYFASVAGMMKAPVEVQFAQKLAANDKLTRDKALRKLKKWFHTRSSVSMPFQDDEQLRFYNQSLLYILPFLIVNFVHPAVSVKSMNHVKN